MFDGTEVMFEDLQSSRNSSVAEIQPHDDGHAGKGKRQPSKEIFFVLSKPSSVTPPCAAAPSAN